MIMHSAAAFVEYALLATLLAGAVLSDLRSRRIPNRLVVAGIGLALAVHAVATITGSPALAGRSWWAPLAGFSAGLALLMPLHLLHAMGAGDVKLMAMVGAFLGAPGTLVAALYTLAAGGLLSLVFMLGRGVSAQALANLRLLLADWMLRAGSGQQMRPAPLQATAARLPYAVAIALGTAASLLWPPAWV
jgi:prepilin peptidase CpaA